LEAITGVKAPTRTIPMFALAVMAALQEVWSRISGKPVLVNWQGYKTIREEGGRNEFDTTETQRELGVTFRPLEDTLRDAVRWFAARGALTSSEVEQAALPQQARAAAARAPAART